MVKMIPKWFGVSLICLSMGLMGCHPNAVEPQADNGSATIAQAESYFKKGHYAKAADIYRPLAEKGDPRAQYALGYMYFYGKGLTSDPEQSAHWINLAAQQNYTPAIKAKTTMTPHRIAENDAAVKLDPENEKILKNHSQVYGPTTDKDTLWSIANQFRTDPSISSQQMMMAFIKANPQAFLGSNINGMKLRQVLVIPDIEEAKKISKEDALNEIAKMDVDWKQ